ncbi:MAG: hypothetical protein QNJ12_15115 [Ilumatobacter sp.]|uniref:hypothetical protein n=1 Tax=Ilumatobacter sp. TaxID=1967498 RepID=UPI002633F9C4|nr:hypothetical protein [Ilumatobacter sp.]MDJ0770130.1 hypothetical protein [Ilumatobacter sp.]
MSIVGADIAALRGFAWSLRRRKQEIEATRQRLAATVENLPWTGSDHDRFVDEWRRVHSPGLMQLTGELSNASNEAYYHANRQEQASRRWS